MGTPDPRFARAHDALVAGMTALLDERPLHEVTVTELVARSGVSRPTFYQHCGGSIGTLAAESALVRLRAVFPPEPAGRDDSPAVVRAEARALLADLVSHLDRHRAFYLRVLDGAPTLELQGALVDLLREQTAEKSPLRDAVDFAGTRVTVVHAGMVWFLMDWLRADEPGREPAEAVVERLVRVLMEEFFGPSS
ncbi:TetR/AcrR family transcriptional regulator [Aeromicrobium sp. 179-A 4D2 NHS]|uniref:TetR/AcrR family transcriptional regulator n=1 Tax=Aeromicrobium sp. 179-A 4D2 NHS TaxID=3142375 RepID=UPI0039A041C1